MKGFLGMLALLACVFAPCLPLLAAEAAPGKPILLEGTWTQRGLRNIIGAGSDSTVILKKDGGNWTITYETIRYPSVNEKNATPKTTREGPFQVTVEDQEMVIVRDKKRVRYTFLCDPTRLIMPAIVQKKPGEWAFKADYEAFSVRCEDNPFKVPVGKAQVPGTPLGKGFYAFEEEPQTKFSPRAQCLRYLERSDEKGQLIERFRLIFDAYGLPRYERLLGNGERMTNEYQNRIFLAAK